MFSAMERLDHESIYDVASVENMCQILSAMLPIYSAKNYGAMVQKYAE